MSRTLSEREQNVLREIAQGSSNEEIGARLGMQLGTVKSHLRVLYAKIGAANRAHAAAIAVRRLKC